MKSSPVPCFLIPPTSKHSLHNLVFRYIKAHMHFKSLGRSRRRMSFIWSALVCPWFQMQFLRITKFGTDTSFKIKETQYFFWNIYTKQYTCNLSFNMNSRCHLCKLLWAPPDVIYRLPLHTSKKNVLTITFRV